MQEIDVVKKSSMSWLWILIALAVIAAVLWFVMGGGASTPRTGELLNPTFQMIASAATA